DRLAAGDPDAAVLAEIPIAAAGARDAFPVQSLVAGSRAADRAWNFDPADDGAGSAGRGTSGGRADPICYIALGLPRTSLRAHRNECWRSTSTRQGCFGVGVDDLERLDFQIDAELAPFVRLFPQRGSSQRVLPEPVDIQFEAVLETFAVGFDRRQVRAGAAPMKQYR